MFKQIQEPDNCQMVEIDNTEPQNIKHRFMMNSEI